MPRLIGCVRKFCGVERPIRSNAVKINILGLIASETLAQVVGMGIWAVTSSIVVHGELEVIFAIHRGSHRTKMAPFEPWSGFPISRGPTLHYCPASDGRLVSQQTEAFTPMAFCPSALFFRNTLVSLARVPATPLASSEPEVHDQFNLPRVIQRLSTGIVATGIVDRQLVGSPRIGRLRRCVQELTHLVCGTWNWR